MRLTEFETRFFHLLFTGWAAGGGEGEVGRPQGERDQEHRRGELQREYSLHLITDQLLIFPPLSPLLTHYLENSRGSETLLCPP